MGRLENIIIHCLDTPPNMSIKEKNIYIWHMSPRLQSNGKYTFLGIKNIEKRFLNLGNDEIISKWREIINNQKYISKCIMASELLRHTGRGWDRSGYRGFISQQGELRYLWNNDEDGYLDNDERTWGATGFNSNSIHYAVEGGYNIVTGRQNPSKNLLFPYNEVMSIHQQETLSEEIRRLQTNIGRKLNIMGHNEISEKTCPNFDVRKFKNDYKL